MKLSFTAVLSMSAVLCGFTGQAVARSGQPVLVTAPVDKVFVPSGFDDNDNVEIVVHGSFPNTCYKIGPATATVAAGVVTVEAKAFLYRSIGCIQMIVPFTQSVKLGIVNTGSYEIKVEDRPNVETVPLAITRARTASPDDFLYAPTALVALDETTPGQYAVRIEGEFPYMFIGCMVMREVRTYVSPGNTLVVLPIAELVNDDVTCDAQVSKKFVVTQPVGALAAEEFLIHVRVLEGNSINRFVSLETR